MGTKTTPQSYKVKKKKYFSKSDQKKIEEILFILQAQKGKLSSYHREMVQQMVFKTHLIS